MELFGWMFPVLAGYYPDHHISGDSRYPVAPSLLDILNGYQRMPDRKVCSYFRF